MSKKYRVLFYTRQAVLKNACFETREEAVKFVKKQGMSAKSEAKAIEQIQEVENREFGGSLDFP